MLGCGLEWRALREGRIAGGLCCLRLRLRGLMLPDDVDMYCSWAEAGLVCVSVSRLDVVIIWLDDVLSAFFFELEASARFPGSST